MDANRKATLKSTSHSSRQLFEGKKKIAIFFAVNSAYAPYLGVALASLVERARKHEYEIIVLYHDLSERSRELLERIVDQFKRESAGRFQLRFMEMPI